MQFIKSVTLINIQGVKIYRVGDQVENNIIHTIEQRPLYFQGDPFDHYVGLTAEGKMLFSVNCLVPCDVVYFVN